MNALPVAGFFAALVLTTYCFDELENNQYGVLLHFVYAIVWGLLGAAVLLICDMQAPHTVAPNATLLAGGLAIGAGVEISAALARHDGPEARNLRWLVTGIVAFASTTIMFR